MFTGIIENLGKVENVKETSLVFSVGQKIYKKINQGTSVSVNGVCLTVVNKPTKKTFVVEVVPETLSKTMLGKLKKRDLVNLELPATTNTLLSGHIVQGHIDGVGEIKEIKTEGNSRIIKIQAPSHILEYVVEKGSVALNGVSLTVVSVDKKNFYVAIVPFTWKKTMLSKIMVGDKINIETDVLGKYLKKFLNK